MSAILQLHTDMENGVGTYRRLPPADSAVYDLPFAGINVDLQQYEDEDERLERLHTLEQSGFGWARQRISWDAIEPQPGDYQWEESDSIIDSIRAAGLEPIIVLDGSPAWARAPADKLNGGNALAPPAKFEDYARFTAAFASRYTDEVRYYQIWDEPNISPHWGNRWINPVEYAQMLRLASSAIRESDPDAIILLGALAPTTDRGHQGIDEVHFLERVYASGAQPYFDAVAIQPFGFGHTPEDSTQQLDVLNFQRAQLVRRAMIAAGDGETPIVAVRYGWNRRLHSPWGSVSRSNQTEFAGRALELAYRNWPWLAGMGWAVDRPDTKPLEPVWGFSLNSDLRETHTLWNAQRPPRSTLIFVPPQRDWLHWVILLAAAAIAVWRMRAALRILPWRDWGRTYRGLSPVIRVGVWLLLFLTYHFSVWPPLIALCWIVAALLIMAQPSAGLWLAAMTLPFYFRHKELQWGDVSLTVAPAIAASFCLLPALFAHRNRILRAIDRWDLLAMGWLAVVLISAVGAWHWPAYLRGVIEFAISPLILFWAVRAFTKSGKDRRRVLTALVVGGVLAASIGLIGWLQGDGTEVDSVRRLVSAYFSANHAALYLERILFITLGLALFNKSFLRWIYALAATIIALALFLTASRGALMLGLPAGVIILVLYGIGHHRARTSGGRLTLLALLLFSLLTALFGAAARLSWERFSNSATIVQRWRLWRSAVDLWLDYWLTGVGPNGFYWRFPAYIPIDSSLDPNLQHPHNLWLEFATTGGIIAIAWLVVTIGLAIHALFSAHKSQSPAPSWPAVGVLAAFAAALAHAQVDAFAALPDLAAWNWLALGLLTAGFTGARTRISSQYPKQKAAPYN